MDGINFIQDLATVLLAAGIAGILCKRIGLSVVVGYLLAGMVIGPFTPPFSLILDVPRIETLSQVGLVFLMFAIGLGLSLTKLRQMGVSTLIATGLGAFIVLNLTQLLGVAVGWSSAQSLVIAAMLMVSSSAVIAKIIEGMNLGHERAAQVALTITVMEDVVAVVMLTVLASQSAASGAATSGLGSLLTGMTAFVVLLVLAGLFFVPRLLRRLEKKADPELQTIVVTGVLFLMALLAVKAGYSLALGAFLLGAIVAEMPQKTGVERAFAGMRDVFSSVFFVSIGMMIDVRLMLEVWPWVLGLTAFALVARPIATGLALIAVGMPPGEARRAGLLLTPLGEFTFVIAQLGVSSGVLPEAYYSVAVGASILTVLVTPLVNRSAGPILGFVDRIEPGWLKRSFEIYHGWLAQLGNAQAGQVWWTLSKTRLLQIGMEVLFISGLLTFSGMLLRAVQESRLAGIVEPLTLTIAFWSVIGILVLVPLVAIWRNVGALALIFAELASGKSRLPGPLVETGFKVVSAVALASWLWQVVPFETLSRWAIVGVGVATVGVLTVFSRRLIYWHSEWQSSLKDVFAANAPGESRVKAQWMRRSSDWGITVQELILPEHATASGKTIMELGVRSRFGCTVVEVDRQGHILIAPEPTQTLYAGDRLLLLGTPAQIAAARGGLAESTVPDKAAAFNHARLETVRVPEGPHAGRTLAELKITRHLGVLIVGVNRGGNRIVNPSGSERISVDDELLVLGAPDQLRLFSRWLAGE